MNPAPMWDRMSVTQSPVFRRGTRYFFVVSAYSSGGESGLSDEVSSLAD